MLYFALALLFFALLFFWQSNRQRSEAGLPGGRVIYTDTRGPLNMDFRPAKKHSFLKHE